MTLSESLERVIQTWQRDGIGLLPPASEEQIHAVMNEIGQRTSADVVQFYRSTGGFQDGHSDDHFWFLWPLDRVRDENAARNGPRWTFSDYSIGVFFFCFQYENEFASSVWWRGDGTDDYRVASSVAEFFEFYLMDPQRVSLF